MLSQPSSKASSESSPSTVHESSDRRDENVCDDEVALSQRCCRRRWEGKAAVAAACDDVGEGKDGVLY